MEGWKYWRMSGQVTMLAHLIIGYHAGMELFKRLVILKVVLPTLGLGLERMEATRYIFISCFGHEGNNIIRVIFLHVSKEAHILL